jgi:hypothetical protein
MEQLKVFLIHCNTFRSPFLYQLSWSASHNWDNSQLTIQTGQILQSIQTECGCDF